MKSSQAILVFICIFVFLVIGVLAITISPTKLLAQPPIPPVVGEAPSIGADLVLQAIQTSSEPNLPSAINVDSQVYLPIINNTPSCSLNAEESTLASLIINDPNQQRPSMTCDPTLAEVARQRAQDMGQQNYFSHVNPSGDGPNVVVYQAGYPLPVSWLSPPDLNYIESIAGGFTSASETFTTWIGENDHQPNILGEDPFWAEQTNYGVGYAYVENSDYQRYWVFISAPPR